MKKLIPALCLLLLSAIVLGASSYAWFSMNGVVKATGMQVTASVPSSLSISVTDEDNGFGATVALTNDSSMGATILPSTYAATANASDERDFFKLSANAMATVNENGVLGTIVESSDNPATIEDNDYYDLTTADYFKDTIWLRYDGTESETVSLNVKIEWDNTNVDDVIKNAFHIVFIDEEGGILVDYDMSEADSTKALGLSLISGAATGTKITAYGFISGSDKDCKNSAISSNTTLKVKITFFGAEG